MAKLRSAYSKRTNVDATFKHANNPIADATQIRHLNYLNDNIVVFTAHEESSNSPAPSSNTLSRAPLAPVNVQPPGNTNILNDASVKPVIKPEPTFASPYKTLQHVPAAANISSPYGTGNVRLSQPSPVGNVPIKDEQGRSTPQGSLNQAGTLERGDGASGQGFSQYGKSTEWYCICGTSFRGYFEADNFFTANSPARFGQSHIAAARETHTITQQNRIVKAETEDDAPMLDAEPEPALEISAPKRPVHSRLQKLMEEGSPETLEAEVRSTQKFLESLKKPMVDNAAQHRDAKHWVRQIETLQKHKVDTPTIIGVVGNTGAGKSSVINAMLEEERLVPTNCMRACTAVVTEMVCKSGLKS